MRKSELRIENSERRLPARTLSHSSKKQNYTRAREPAATELLSAARTKVDNASCMGETQWYVSESGQRQGPFTGVQMSERAAAGRLRPSTLVWSKGFDQWKRAGTVPELMRMLTETAPSGPEAPQTGAAPTGDPGETTTGGEGPREADPEAETSARETAEEDSGANAGGDEPGGDGEGPATEAGGEAPVRDDAVGVEGYYEPVRAESAEDQSDAPDGRPLPVVVRVPISVAALAVAALLLLYFHAFRIAGFRPNPFHPVLPARIADLAGWGVFFFLPCVGAISGLGLLFGPRWAAIGQTLFWGPLALLAGAAAGFCAPAATTEVRAFAGVLSWSAPVAARVRAALGGAPRLEVAGGVLIGFAVIAFVLLCWRMPRRSWERRNAPAADGSDGDPGDDRAFARRLCLLALSDGRTSFSRGGA